MPNTHQALKEIPLSAVKKHTIIFSRTHLNSYKEYACSKVSKMIFLACA